MQFYQYPHLDLNQANLDWIINELKRMRQELNDLENGTVPDGVEVPQFNSYPGHTPVTQRQIAVLDEAGNIYGDSININDVMLKPRRCASGAIGVFDDHGNLIPTSLDENTPVITLEDVAIVADDSKPDSSTQIFHLANGFCMFARKISVTLDNLTAAGGVYRQSITLNDLFPVSFASAPYIIVTPSDNVNAACWVGAATFDQYELKRITFFAHQSNSINVDLSYIAIGRKELSIV